VCLGRELPDPRTDASRACFVRRVVHLPRLAK
jgi:hypothetical protein